MPKYNVTHASRFNTLAQERNYYMRIASTGYVTVDLEHCPPSDRGAIADLIKRGLLGTKHGSKVPLTKKGSKYIERHGLGIVAREVLSPAEMEVFELLGACFLARLHRQFKTLTAEERSLAGRRFVAMREVEDSRKVMLVPTEAGLELLGGMGHRRICAMIDKTQDQFLRDRYTGPETLLSFRRAFR